MSASPEATSTFGRLAVGAVGLIVAAAVLFALIGAVTDEDTDPVAGDPTEDVTPTATESPTGGGDVTDEPTSPAPTTPAETATPTPTDGATETATDDPTTDPRIDPATVSVQVLDAVLDDAGATAAEVADQLAADGYQLIAENPAVRVYEQTTVFFVADNRPAAQQIAEDYGFSVVEPAPDNLSSSVDVHVVVGQDA